MTDEQKLTDRLADLVADEPPFEIPLGPALWAAEQHGRRRRSRERVLRVTVVAASCAAAVALAAVLLPGPGPNATVRPAGHGSGTTAASPTNTPTPTPAPAAEGELRHLVATIAEQVEGEARITQTGRGADLEFQAEVRTSAGQLTLSALLDDEADGVANRQDSCDLEAKGHDGRICRTLLQRDTIGVWDTDSTGRKGRRTLQAAAVTPQGGTVAIVIDNYVELEDGSKVVGPDWERSGITVDGLRAAIAASGLALPDR